MSKLLAPTPAVTPAVVPAARPIQRAAAPAPAMDAATPAALPRHDFAALAIHPPAVGAPLPPPVRSKMEQSFAADFSTVRVSQGPDASRLQALAYTQGESLHFAPRRYDPDSASGQRLIGHELAHVLQQRAGRVDMPQGKDAASGAPVNRNPQLEAEADRAGERAAAGLPVQIAGVATGRPTTATVQPKLIQLHGDDDNQQQAAGPNAAQEPRWKQWLKTIGKGLWTLFKAPTTLGEAGWRLFNPIEQQVAPAPAPAPQPDAQAAPAAAGWRDKLWGGLQTVGSGAKWLGQKFLGGLAATVGFGVGLVGTAASLGLSALGVGLGAAAGTAAVGVGTATTAGLTGLGVGLGAAAAGVGVAGLLLSGLAALLYGVKVPADAAYNYLTGSPPAPPSPEWQNQSWGERAKRLFGGAATGFLKLLGLLGGGALMAVGAVPAALGYLGKRLNRWVAGKSDNPDGDNRSRLYSFGRNVLQFFGLPVTVPGAILTRFGKWVQSAWTSYTGRPMVEADESAAGLGKLAGLGLASPILLLGAGLAWVGNHAGKWLVDKMGFEPDRDEQRVRTGLGFAKSIGYGVLSPLTALGAGLRGLFYELPLWIYNKEFVTLGAQGNGGAPNLRTREAGDAIGADKRAPHKLTFWHNLRKYALALSLVASSGGAAFRASPGNFNGTGTGGASGGAAGGTLALLNVIDAASALYTEYQRGQEADTFNDAAAKRMAARGKSNAIGTLISANFSVISAACALASYLQQGTSGVLGADQFFSYVQGAGSSFVSNIASTVGSSFALAGGAITFGTGLKGLWSTHGHLKRLRDLHMASTLGQTKWLPRVQDRLTMRRRMLGLKTLSGALGIAAGALVLASNPVGWALGIAAAAIGGAFAVAKIGKTLYDLWQRRKAKVGRGREVAATEDAIRTVDEAYREDHNPEGNLAPELARRQLDRRIVKRQADAVARLSSENSLAAGQMIDAIKLGLAHSRHPVALSDEQRLQYSDALKIIEALGLTRDQVVSVSGQEMLEAKLSMLHGV